MPQVLAICTNLSLGLIPRAGETYCAVRHGLVLPYVFLGVSSLNLGRGQPRPNFFGSAVCAAVQHSVAPTHRSRLEIGGFCEVAIIGGKGGPQRLEECLRGQQRAMLRLASVEASVRE